MKSPATLNGYSPHFGVSGVVMYLERLEFFSPTGWKIEKF